MDRMDDPSTRLYVTQDLANGRELPLSPAQYHQLRNVLRLEDGAAVSLFNGHDGEWLARVRFERKACLAAIERRLHPQEPPPDVWLAFAPVKHARLDFLVEKATELGAARLLPVLTERTQVSRIGTEKLWERAREAAEQCGRLDVPEVTTPQRLDAMLAAWDHQRALYLCAEAGPSEPAMAAFVRTRGPAAILVGPEGGFSAAEFERLRGCAFVTPVGLGPRILRAETAALAALACWHGAAGDGLS